MTTLYELRHGESFVRIAPELGGRITRCALLTESGEAVDILHPYPEAHTDLLHWAKGGLYPLVPYWGRVADAQLHYAGRCFTLQPHPDALPHTLHGTAHQVPWRVTFSDSTQLTMQLRQESDAHWPWRYQAELKVALGGSSLRVDVSVVNMDDVSMPVGIGLHPYVLCGAAPYLQFQAARSWEMSPDFLGLRATGVSPADDFSRGRSLDTAPFTRCYGEWDGRLAMEGAGGGEGRPLRLFASPALDQLVLHRPDAAPYVCIEPVSHTADAFNLAAAGIEGTGARQLNPGQRLAGSIEFAIA